MTARPRHAAEPFLDVDGFQRRCASWIVADLRRFQRCVECPGHLFEFERTALANAALIGIRESPGVDEHRSEAGRSETSQRAFRMSAVRQALRPNPAVAPRLLDDPGAAVIAVASIAEILDVVALRIST